MVGVVFGAGLSFAQEEVAKMPEQVREFLDALTGTWTYDGAASGSITTKWDGGKGCIVMYGQEDHEDFTSYWTEFIHWDGVSDDGIVLSSASAWSKGYQCSNAHGTVLSPTLMKGKKTDIVNGHKIKADCQVEFVGKDKFISEFTNNIFSAHTKRLNTGHVLSVIEPRKCSREYPEV